MMNFNEAIFYQIYALSFGKDFCQRVTEWIPHIKSTGANAIYFNPIFQSDNHGYDTQDYYTLDRRLGTNEDFALLCQTLHQNGLAVMLDGVFNHVGRGFWAFRDVQQNGQNSAYKDWFILDWNRQSNYGDAFWYEGWEGCFDLVKLNLKNPAVKEHLFGAVCLWKEKFDIDALRLDVAYCLDREFLSELHCLCRELGIFVLGETIHSESMRLVNDGLLDSATNYEVYKGLHSSINNHNMFEVNYSLNRLFGRGGIYEQKIATNPLFTFVDNHDVSRIASVLQDKTMLPLIYGLLFTLPGTPCLYYGSEWQIEGRKDEGDTKLRPNFDKSYWNALTDFVHLLSKVRQENNALKYGTFETLFITNYQMIFKREHTDPFTGKRTCVLVSINLGASEYYAVPNGSSYGAFGGVYGKWKNLFTGSDECFNGCFHLPPKSVMVYELD